MHMWIYWRFLTWKIQYLSKLRKTEILKVDISVQRNSKDKTIHSNMLLLIYEAG